MAEGSQTPEAPQNSVVKTEEVSRKGLGILAKIAPFVPGVPGGGAVLAFRDLENRFPDAKTASAEIPVPVVNPKTVESQINTEVPKATSTEASNFFLAGWKNKLSLGLPLAIPLVTGLAIRFSGPLPTEDIARGDYKTAAIKGVIGAASFIPLGLKFRTILRENNVNA